MDEQNSSRATDECGEDSRQNACVLRTIVRSGLVLVILCALGVIVATWHRGPWQAKFYEWMPPASASPRALEQQYGEPIELMLGLARQFSADGQLVITDMKKGPTAEMLRRFPVIESAMLTKNDSGTFHKYLALSMLPGGTYCSPVPGGPGKTGVEVLAEGTKYVYERALSPNAAGDVYGIQIVFDRAGVERMTRVDAKQR